MHLSVEGKKSVGGTGALFQSFSTDVGRVSNILPFVLGSSDLVFRLVGAFAYLFVLTKVAAFGALAVLFIVLPINYFISDQFIAKYINKMAAGDARHRRRLWRSSTRFASSSTTRGRSRCAH